MAPQRSGLVTMARPTWKRDCLGKRLGLVGKKENQEFAQGQVHFLRWELEKIVTKQISSA